MAEVTVDTLHDWGPATTTCNTKMALCTTGSPHVISPVSIRRRLNGFGSGKWPARRLRRKSQICAAKGNSEDISPSHDDPRVAPVEAREVFSNRQHCRRICSVRRPSAIHSGEALFEFKGWPFPIFTVILLGILCPRIRCAPLQSCALDNILVSVLYIVSYAVDCALVQAYTKCRKSDLKSAGAYPPWGFKSPSGHQQESHKISGLRQTSPSRGNASLKRNSVKVSRWSAYHVALKGLQCGWTNRSGLDALGVVSNSGNSSGDS